MAKLKISVEGPTEKVKTSKSRRISVSDPKEMTQVQKRQKPTKKSTSGTVKKTISISKPTTKKSITVSKSKTKDSSPTSKTTTKKTISVSVAPQKTSSSVPRNASRTSQHPISSTSTHRSVQKSTTLSRRYVKRPSIKTVEDKSHYINIVEVSAAESKKEEKLALRKARMAKMSSLRPHKKSAKPVTQAKSTVSVKSVTSNKPTTQAKPAVHTEPASVVKISNRTKNALEAKQITQKSKLPLTHSVVNSSSVTSSTNAVSSKKVKDSSKVLKQSIKHKHRGRRIALAVFCALAVIGGLGVFLYFNMPNISVKVIAMQTGIEASYPSFTPRGYSLSGASSDKEGIVTILFTNTDGASFSLTEEQSTWDSNALLNNYVKKHYPSDYTTIREQGITIYYRGGKAAWVNGGMLYKIECEGNALTKEQVRNIASSM